MNEHADVPEPGSDPVTDRLRDLGRAPIDEATRDAHVRAMRADAPDLPVADRRPPRRRLAIAAAAVVGFLAGSTGLAFADALPGPAQEAASDVLAVVGLDVPSGKEGKRGPCVSEAAKIEDPVAKQEAKDACPKGPFGRGPDEAPGRGGSVPEGSDRPDVPPGQADKADDPCKGKPPWAGKHDLTDAEVDAAKAERAACDGAAEAEPGN